MATTDLVEVRRIAGAQLAGEAPPPAMEVEPVVAPTPPRITTGAGSASVRKNWKVEVEDVRALCAAVAAGDLPVQAVAPNVAFLRSMVTNTPKDQREALRVPGVRFYADESLAVR